MRYHPRFRLPERPRRGARLGSFVLAVLLSACGPGESTDSESSSALVDFLTSHEKLYSQFDEELLIRHFFRDEREGVFVDVGCAYPVKLSTTFYLEKHLGWSGIAIDALERYRKGWVERRPNSTFLAYAVTDRDDETITFHVAKEPSVSSLSERQAEKWGGPESVPVEVPTITLNKVLEDQGIERIDFLSMDIEGAEPTALAGFDIERFQPRLVCVEAHTNAGANEEEILAYFDAHGYALIEEFVPHDMANWYFAPRAEPEGAPASPD